ncbi:response regulator transcription factor [Streptomyces sp. NBC_01210]|uniref:response regulator transcription factor n=1 Tax=Streptomyces sp. NBC_01210 TaxID=2903774 RepID=UPI003FA38BBF
MRRNCRPGADAWFTTTERLIADHVTKGQSNPKAAARMGISPRTVSTHVSNILRKPGMTSPVEITAEAIRRQESKPPPPLVGNERHSHGPWQESLRQLTDVRRFAPKYFHLGGRQTQSRSSTGIPPAVEARIEGLMSGRRAH